MLATVISTTGLAYLDILMAPPIIAMVGFLNERRFGRATVAFLAATLMKLQPIILLPGIIAFAVQTLRPSRLDWRTIAICSGITVAIFVCTLAVFHLAFLASFDAGFSQQGWLLSGNAANPFYLVTELMTYGSGNDNPFVTIYVFPYLWPWVKLPFYCAAVPAVVIYLQAKKTVENLLIFSILLFWLYYQLAPGAHENHLALAVFLAFTLSARNRAQRWIVGLTALAFNLNLVAFYYTVLTKPHLAQTPLEVTLVIRATVSLASIAIGVVVIFLCARALLRARSQDRDGVLVMGGSISH